MKARVCLTCKGTGKIKQDGEKIDCPTCNGTGAVEGSATSPQSVMMPLKLSVQRRGRWVIIPASALLLLSCGLAHLITAANPRASAAISTSTSSVETSTTPSAPTATMTFLKPTATPLLLGPGATSTPVIIFQPRPSPTSNVNVTPTPHATSTPRPHPTSTIQPTATATPIPPPVTLDDSSARFTYHGDGWVHVNGDSRFYDGTFSYDAHTSDQVCVTFIGSRVLVYSDKAFNLGYADYMLDGVSVGKVDQYAQNVVPGILLFDSGTLPRGTHTLSIAPDGTQDPQSDGDYITLDDVVLWS